MDQQMFPLSPQIVFPKKIPIVISQSEKGETFLTFFRIFQTHQFIIVMCVSLLLGVTATIDQNPASLPPLD